MADLRGIVFACVAAATAIGPPLHAYRIKDKEPRLIKTLPSPLNKVVITYPQVELSRSVRNAEENEMGVRASSFAYLKEMPKQPSRHARDTNQLSPYLPDTKESMIRVARSYPWYGSGPTGLSRHVRDKNSLSPAELVYPWRETNRFPQYVGLSRNARNTNQLLSNELEHKGNKMRDSYVYSGKQATRVPRRHTRDTYQLSPFEHHTGKTMMGVDISYPWDMTIP